MRNPSVELFSNVDAAGVSEAIVRRVGELIGSGELRAGDRLPPEIELAESFGVAPMTVRTALQVLREYGLVITRRGRGGGTFVHDAAADAAYFQDTELPSIEEFEDLTVWREAVSGEASALAAASFAAGTVTDSDRDRLLALTDASHASGLSPAEYRFADAELHRFIAELAGSPRLSDAERGIQAFLTRTLRHMRSQPPDPSRLSAQAHTALVSAITAGDAEAARRELRIHVRSTRDMAIGVRYLRQAGSRSA